MKIGQDTTKVAFESMQETNRSERERERGTGRTWMQVSLSEIKYHLSYRVDCYMVSQLDKGDETAQIDRETQKRCLVSTCVCTSVKCACVFGQVKRATRRGECVGEPTNQSTRQTETDPKLIWLLCTTAVQRSNKEARQVGREAA
jgi:hypothetical protein